MNLKEIIEKNGKEPNSFLANAIFPYLDQSTFKNMIQLESTVRAVREVFDNHSFRYILEPLNGFVCAVAGSAEDIYSKLTSESLDRFNRNGLSGHGAHILFNICQSLRAIKEIQEEKSFDNASNPKFASYLMMNGLLETYELCARHFDFLGPDTISEYSHFSEQLAKAVRLPETSKLGSIRGNDFPENFEITRPYFELVQSVTQGFISFSANFMNCALNDPKKLSGLEGQLFSNLKEFGTIKPEIESARCETKFDIDFNQVYNQIYSGIWAEEDKKKENLLVELEGEREARKISYYNFVEKRNDIITKLYSVQPTVQDDITFLMPHLNTMKYTLGKLNSLI